MTDQARMLKIMTTKVYPLFIRHSFVLRHPSFARGPIFHREKPPQIFGHPMSLRGSRLFGRVENATALLTTDDFVTAFRSHHRRRRHFHMASGANTVLDCNHGNVALAGK